MPRRSKSTETKTVVLNMRVEWEHFCSVDVPVDVTDEELRDVAWSILESPCSLDSNEGPVLQECWFDDDDEPATPEYEAKRKGRKMTVAEVNNETACRGVVDEE